MLSCMVSELFWMVCYFEWVESYVWVLDVIWKLLMIFCYSQQLWDLVLLLNLLMIYELFQVCYVCFIMSNLFNFFVFDGNNFCSIYSCVEMVWNNVYVVCGSLLVEVWESINVICIELWIFCQ